jgi:hypothetical protein
MNMIPTEKDFDNWWDSDYFPDPKTNIRKDSPMWWSWQGWLAAVERMGSNETDATKDRG